MAAAKFSSQYISDRFLPDKAIDLIDEAGSRVRLRHIQLPEEARDLDKELKQVRGWQGEGGGGDRAWMGSSSRKGGVDKHTQLPEEAWWCDPWTRARPQTPNPSPKTYL